MFIREKACYTVLAISNYQNAKNRIWGTKNAIKFSTVSQKIHYQQSMRTGKTETLSGITGVCFRGRSGNPVRNLWLLHCNDQRKQNRSGKKSGKENYRICFLKKIF